MRPSLSPYVRYPVVNAVSVVGEKGETETADVLSIIHLRPKEMFRCVLTGRIPGYSLFSPV